MKKLFVLFAGIILISLSFANTTSAESVNNNDIPSFTTSCLVNEIVMNDETKKQYIDENGLETIEITDPVTLESIEAHLDKPNPDLKLQSFVIKKEVGEEVGEEVVKTGNKISPTALYTGIKVTNQTEGCGSSRIGYTSGKGTIYLSVSRSVATEINASMSVDLDKFNAETGIGVQKSVTVTSSTDYTAPKDQVGVIEAYPHLNIYSFNLTLLGIKVGSGYLYEADGVCFAKYY